MTSMIEKCTNGVSIIVPEQIAERAGLHAGNTAQLDLEAGNVVIRANKVENLDDLLSRITPENLHSEHFSGTPVGMELL